MNKEQFRIIAVRPRKGCAAHIRKILKEDMIYFLYNDYEEDAGNNIGWIKKKERKEIFPNFFCRDSKSTPLISISAIVGKNGDGKSSLIELIIRMINNFAYTLNFNFKIKNEESQLIFVKGVAAELYFAIGTDLYLLKEQGKKIELFLNNEPIQDIQQYVYENSIFYSIIANYSLYAYNVYDFKREWDSNKCWLNSIFHKNDGYQTPILLHPFRGEGNIDINNLNYLTEQQLISLFITDPSFRNINNTKLQVQSLSFSLSPESKLKQKTLGIYFEENKNTNKSFPINLSVFNYLKGITDSIDDSVKQKIDSIYLRLKNLKQYVQDVGTVIDSATQAYAGNKSNEDFRNEIIGHDDTSWPDIYELIRKLISVCNPKSEKNIIIDLIEICYGLKSSDVMLFNSVQFMRIVLVDFFKQEWNKIFNEEYSSKFIINNEYDEKIKNQLIDYLVYKSISIIEKYPQFKEYNIENDFLTFLDTGQLQDDIKTKYREAIQKMRAGKSHITLKIRQVLNFMEYNGYDINLREENILFTDYCDKIHPIYEKNKDKYEIIDFLLPPIFNEEVILNPENIELSHLSSGERQLLNIASFLIYNLRNINSVEEQKDVIKYRHVNIIFEEIELYFHPEYQRQLVKYLLDSIKKINLPEIESINMCFVTHSPFILSDIPKNNVLFLKDGMPDYGMQEDTFGSNIHTLLQNGFFLNSVPIGDFAKQKINTMFEQLHKNEINDELYNEILLVSEPFIRSQLLKLYNELVPNKMLNNELQKLRTKIKILEDQINDKNRSM
jgi:energy-coupling factor transporter ATP-binding protein EcfA2